MTLNPPFEISARLLAAVRVGDATISITFGKGRYQGRAIYRYYIDTPKFEYSGADLRSGVGGGTLQEGMASLFSFLSAAADSYSYRQRTGASGEKEDLFPAYVTEWAYQNADEIAALACELQETPNLITP